MGSIGNPNTWVPYVNSKDCSQGFCSLYCPQWCYPIFPPPPRPSDEFLNDDSGLNFSPLVIAIIGIFSSAFLLITYYVIISKYCGYRLSSSRGRESRASNTGIEENQGPPDHEFWYVPTNGLDEDVIKSITMFKYKKEDGLIDGTDCSVCLSQFEENESLRLLPKCSHAFHVQCIDTWLKSHSNCPICRANIASANPLSPPSAYQITETPLDHNESRPWGLAETENSATVADIQIDIREDESLQGKEQNSLRNSDIRDTATENRRSVSMDYISEHQLSIADTLNIEEAIGSSLIKFDGSRVFGLEGDLSYLSRTNRKKNDQTGKCRFSSDIGTSVRPVYEKNRRSCSSTSPVVMKRSHSFGGFFLSKHGRVIPF